MNLLAKLGLVLRAVQRSLHDPQREHCIDASDSDAIAPVTHVVHVVEAEDIGGEGSQASKDAGVAADPTVVLAEADIADIMQPVLDPPMATDGVSAGCGGQGNVGNEVGDLAGSLPQAGCGDALERVAGDADDRRDVIGPFGVGQGGAGSKHLDHTDFIAGSPLLIRCPGLIQRCRALAQFGNALVQGRLIGLDLGDDVSAGCCNLLECFFDSVGHQPS